MLLAGGATGSVGAATTATGNATVSITSDTATNFLAVSITNASFGSRPYSFTATTNVPGSLTVTAIDTRGSALGWNVNLSATDFARDPSTTFDIGNLSLTAGPVAGIATGGGSVPSTAGIVTSSAAPVQKTGSGSTKILSAAPLSGMGTFDLPMTGNLTIPAETLIGAYTSVVSVAIVSGP